MKGPRRAAGLTTILAVTALAVAGLALGVSGAVSTTHNPGFSDSTGRIDEACLNGNGVDCNIYVDKRDVWLSGLPVGSALGAGTYFFAVLSPGGQPAPNDGGTNNSNGALANLSDDFDAYTNRTFTVDGSGNITSYGGTHDRDGNLLQLFPYQDTPNNGGVYILAVCSLANGVPVAPRDCKYDAFKVRSGDEEEQPLSGPTVTKDAAGTNDRDFGWSLQKCLNNITLTSPLAACQHAATLRPTGTSVSVTYYIIVSHDAGTVSNVKVNGNIQVFNGNVDSNNDTIPIDISGLTDELSDGTDCVIKDSGDNDPVFPLTLSSFETDFSFSCSLSALPSGSLSNTATVRWDEQTIGERTLAASSDDFTFSDIAFTETKLETCTNVSDAFNGGAADGLGQVCTTDDNPKVLTKSRTITVQQATCVTYPNIATESADGTTDSDSVTVCGRIGNGFTLGFWSNNNGRAVLCANDPAWRTLMNGNGGGAYLRNGNGTFYSVPTAGSCNNAHANFSTWLLNATATNMQYILSAQLAATRLNVVYKNMNGNACIAGIDGNPITINNLITNAVTFLRTYANTTASGALRNTATAYKNIFDGLNNNLVFAVTGC